MNITARRFQAAQRYSWLRAAYYHADVVESTFNTSAVAEDSDIATPALDDEAPIDYPDALVGGQAIHLSPETEVSKRAHLSRPGVNEPEQLITYEPASPAFLAEVFQ